MDNISPQTTVTVPEQAVQDHSIGSTTNVCTVANDVQQQMNSAEANSEGLVDSSCQEIMNNVDHIFVDEVCTSEIEVTLESKFSLCV